MKLQITLFFFYARIILRKKLLNFKILMNKTTIPFATISIKKIYRIKYTTQSQADGYYEFNQLQPANDYETRITFEGFSPLVWMLFRFNWENH
jgi:hypothetical protein